MLKKILCSLPVILLALYFIPFVGICLLMFRLIYDAINTPKYKRKSSTITYFSANIFYFGLLLILPDLVYRILKYFKINGDFLKYLDDFVNIDIYIKLYGYGKKLLLIGVIAYIISILAKTLFDKSSSTIQKKISDKITNTYNKSTQNSAEEQRQKESEQQERLNKKLEEYKKEKSNNENNKCPYCRSKVDKNLKTCPNCGGKL